MRFQNIVSRTLGLTLLVACGGAMTSPVETTDTRYL